MIDTPIRIRRGAACWGSRWTPPADAIDLPRAGSWARPSAPFATTPTCARPSRAPRAPSSSAPPAISRRRRAATRWTALQGRWLWEPVGAAPSGQARDQRRPRQQLLRRRAGAGAVPRPDPDLLPESRSGMMADAASIRLPKRIPYHVATNLRLTGRWFDASEALRWGLPARGDGGGRAAPRGVGSRSPPRGRPPLIHAAVKEIVHKAAAMRPGNALNRVTKRRGPTPDRLHASEDRIGPRQGSGPNAHTGHCRG